MPSITGILISCCFDLHKPTPGRQIAARVFPICKAAELVGSAVDCNVTLHEAAAYRLLVVGAIVMSATVGVGLSPATMGRAAVRCRGVGFGMSGIGMRFNSVRRLMIHRAAVRCGGVRFGMSCAGTRCTCIVSATVFVGFASARFLWRV
jgi:hypothetical protein